MNVEHRNQQDISSQQFILYFSILRSSIVKNYLDQTEAERLSIIDEAISEICAKEPANTLDRPDMSIFSYIDAGVDLLSDEELRLIAGI